VSEEKAIKQYMAMPSVGLWMSWIEDGAVLRRRALRLTKGNREEAEDLLSATLIKAVTHVERHDTEVREPRAFLLFALKNEYISRFRKFTCERQVRDFGADIYQDHSASLMAPEPDQEDALGNRDLLKHLLKLVSGMPDDVQAIFHLRFCEDCSYREIASRLSISEALARKRVQHLRQHLKSVLERDAELGVRAHPQLSQVGF